MMLSPAARAQDARGAVTITADAGYSNNPFHDAGGSGGSFAELAASPNIALLSERNTISLAGSARLRRYLDNSDKDDMLDLTLGLTHRLSALSTISGGIGFATSRNTLEDVLREVPADTGSGTSAGAPTDSGGSTSTPTTGEDLALIGSRVKRYHAFLSGSFALSPLMSLSVGGSAYKADYSSAEVSNYRGYSGSANLSRRLSERASAGVFVSYSRSSYSGVVTPTSSVVSAGLSGSLQTSERWNMNGQIGAAFSSFNGQVLAEGQGRGHGSSVGLVGSLQVCRRYEYGSLCANVSRQYLPTGLAGTVPQTRADVNYGRRLGERDTLSASVGYVRASASRLGGYDNDFLRVQAGYGHQFRPRLSLSLSAYDRRVIGDGRHIPSDYGARLGLVYRIGEQR